MTEKRNHTARIVSLSSAISIAIMALFLTLYLPFIIPNEAESAPRMGVSNLDSLHLRDSNGTATPNFIADQRGSGNVAEFRVNGTPMARVSNDGALDVLAGVGSYTPQTSVVTASFVITPTSNYILLSSTIAVTSSATTPIITTTASMGDWVLLQNDNASDVIILDGVGGTTACKANISLGAGDIAWLVYNSNDAKWYCVTTFDNS